MGLFHHMTPSNTKLCLRAPIMLPLWLSYLFCSLFGLTQS